MCAVVIREEKAAFHSQKVTVCPNRWKKHFSRSIMDFDRENGREAGFSAEKNKKWGVLL